MTSTELRNYLEGVSSIKPDPTGVAGTVFDQAVILGMNGLWSDWHWPFKYRDFTLVCATSEETYDLPADFDSIKTVKERVHSEGGSLAFYSKSRFDEVFPNPGAYSAGTPIAYTVYQPADAKRWVIAFAPFPTAGLNLYLHYGITPLSEADLFPESLTAALVASCERFIYSAATEARVIAEGVYAKALKDAIRLVGVNTQTIDRVYRDERISDNRPDWAIPE